MPRKVTVIAVHEQARTKEEEDIVSAKKAALDLVANKARLGNVQEMTRHIWDRLIAATAERIDAYPEIDGEIKSIVERAVTAMAQAPKRPK